MRWASPSLYSADALDGLQRNDIQIDERAAAIIREPICRHAATIAQHQR
jgi:hypothetical protein